MPIRGFPTENVVACFSEPNAVGSIDDINAPRNAPVLNPADHLDKITFHSGLFQYEVANGPQDVTVNHTTLATEQTIIGVNPTGGGIGFPTPPAVAVIVSGASRSMNIPLVVHNLGYIPKFMVAYSGSRISDGFTIQNAAQYRRRVSFFSTTTTLFIRETTVTGSVNCPSVSRTYRVIIFKDSEAVPGLPLFGEVSPGRLVLARGVIDSDKAYLRRTGVGDTPFAQNLGVTLDCNSGRLASASGGSIIAETGYAGSLVAPPFISVGVD